jgi:hypothetical protein
MRRHIAPSFVFANRASDTKAGCSREDATKTGTEHAPETD